MGLGQIAESTVLVRIVTQGEERAEKLKRTLESTRKISDRLSGSLQKASNGVRSFGNSANKASSSTQKLVGVVGKLALAFGAAALAQKSLQAGIGRAESERRIKFLAAEYGEVEKLSKAAADAAEKFGQSQTEANKALADVFARLRPVGTSLDEIVTVYNGFNTAAKLSGASSVEASNAFRQLSQALGSGALRGDEFNSIAEQVPGILTGISKETGIAQGKLRDFAAEGGITADIVIRALGRIEREGADKLTQAMGGPEQAIKDFQNATEDVQVALTTSIIPEMSIAFRELAQVILALEGPINYIGGLLGNMLTEARLLIQAVSGQGTAIGTLRAGKLPASQFIPTRDSEGNMTTVAEKEFGEFFGKERFEQLKKQAKEIGKAQGISYAEALKQRLTVALKVIDGAEVIKAERQRAKKLEALLKTKPTVEPSAADTVKVGDTVGSLTPEIIKPNAGFESAFGDASALDERLQNSEQIREQLERSYQLDKRASDLDRARLQNSYDFADVRDRIRRDADASNQDQLIALSQRNEKLKDSILLAQSFQDVFAEGQAIDDALVSPFEELANQAVPMVGQAIQDSIVTALEAAITGADDLGEELQKIASSLLKDLGRMFLRAGINGLGGLTGLPGFASGGFVDSPTQAMVGEGGSDEYIIPANKMSSAMSRYSAGARGDAVVNGADGSGGGGGGVAVADPPTSINIEGGVMQFNDTNYIRQDQVPAIITQASKQGEARALRRLQMSPAARRRAGL